MTIDGGFRIPDRVTEFYQNDVIHELRGLEPIERGTVDQGFIAAYGVELTYQFLQLTRDQDGNTLLRDTPVFAGGGFVLSTIMQDFFVQSGVKRWRYPTVGTSFTWAHLDFSALARVGFLAEGFDFQELAQNYTSLQMSAGLTIAPYRFPIRLEYALTGHSGIFQSSRSGDADSAFGALGPRRSSLREVFSSLRVGIGSWNFETFNDSPGQKDRGPTFGARIWITTFPGELAYAVFNRMLGRLL